MFEIGSYVWLRGKRFKIIRLYPKAGRAEMKDDNGKTVYVKPYFMQWRRQEIS